MPEMKTNKADNKQDLRLRPEEAGPMSLFIFVHRQCLALEHGCLAPFTPKGVRPLLAERGLTPHA